MLINAPSDTPNEGFLSFQHLINLLYKRSKLFFIIQTSQFYNSSFLIN